MITRKEIFDYVKKKYKVEPDYPFPTSPASPVMRHEDNRKWFALIMDVPKEKFGIPGNERVDVINLKLSDPLLIDILVQQPGIYHGYHFKPGNWISIFLDGSVSFEEICCWLDESYAATASGQKKQKIRPPKEWIIPANPKYYDIEHAFDTEKEIDWKQGAGIKKGDTVFIYVAAPVSAIMFKCKVTKTDIPYEYVSGRLQIKRLMKIRLQKRYKPDRFTFSVLGSEYGIYAVRGPRGVPGKLSEDLKR